MDQQRSGRARREGRMWEAWRWLIGCGLGRLYSRDSERQLVELQRSGTAAMKRSSGSGAGRAI